MSFLDKLEETVYLPFTLILIGVAVTAITVWKGVHGFWPTSGIIIGVATVLVGAFYKRIYR